MCYSVGEKTNNGIAWLILLGRKGKHGRFDVRKGGVNVVNVSSHNGDLIYCTFCYPQESLIFWTGSVGIAKRVDLRRISMRRFIPEYAVASTLLRASRPSLSTQSPIPSMLWSGVNLACSVPAFVGSHPSIELTSVGYDAVKHATYQVTEATSLPICLYALRFFFCGNHGDDRARLILCEWENLISVQRE